MTTIALHKYTKKIEQLIEDQQLDEAIAHCRHILQQHPRHVDTYQTLAKAYLERGNYSDAVDLLQRILSTDPSNLIAHAALSVAYKEQSNLDSSIWHLERALDIEPYNTPLREELLELYTLKKAALPDSIGPSSAALARMYLRSGMYQAAITELRHTLAQEPDRLDLKVVLAETLYWANQRVEAVSLALEILDILPNCISVNAILAEIWLQTGRVAEAQVYLKRLQAMTLLDKVRFDPETAVGRAFIARGAPLIPDEILIEQYGEAPLAEPESATAVVAMVDSGWIEEFSMEETDERPGDEAADIDKGGTTGWLVEAALASGEHFGTRPLVMPPDPLEAETDWFVDPGAEDDESLEELLGDVGDDAQLDDWLTGLDTGISISPTDEPKVEEVTGFTGMLSGLLDSELDIVDETAEPVGVTDLFANGVEPQGEDFVSEDISSDFANLFADVTEGQIEDAPVLDLSELTELDLDQFLADKNDESWSEADASAVVEEGDSFAKGLTALFSDMDDADLTVEDSFDEADDIDLDEFLDSDLGALAKADEAEEDEHTGYTQLFDQLSTDAFPGELEESGSVWPTPTSDDLVSDLAEAGEAVEEAEKAEEDDDHTGYTHLFDQLSTNAFPDEPKELGSDWLTPTTNDLVSDWAEAEDEEEAPNWLSEVKEDEFEPVQLDPNLTSALLSESKTPTEPADKALPSDWLTGLSGEEPATDFSNEDDWLAELAGDMPETAVPDSQPPASDELSEVPAWLLGGEQDAQVFETPAPIDFAESVGFETDELEESTAVPTWLLGGDKTTGETDSLDESAPLEDLVPPDSARLRENPQTILAGEQLPDWLQSEQGEPIPAEPLETDSMMSILNEELPGWLTDELPELAEPESQPEAVTGDPLSTDSMTDLVSGDLPSWLVDKEPDVEARPIPEPDSELDLYKDDLNIPDWLMADLAAGQNQAEVSVTGDKDERESVPPQEPEEISESAFDSDEDDDLGWLEELASSISEDEIESASYASRVAAGEGGAIDEPPTQVSMPDELPDFGAVFETPDWPEASEDEESEPDMADVLAGVTGELNADLDWLDSLAEESVAPTDSMDNAIGDFDNDSSWLDALAVAGDTGPLGELGSEPILPDFEDSLATLPEEPDDGLDWLSELEVEAGSPGEVEEVSVDLADVGETAVSSEPEAEDELERLGELAVETEAEEADEALDWLAAPDEEDELEIVGVSETELSELSGLDDSITGEPPEDIEDAMAWLEELAAGQGARLEELPSMTGVLATEPKLGISPEPADDSLDWLDEAGDEDVTAVADVELGLDTDISGIIEPEPAVEDAAPEDIEDAMAWLEGLAAKQGARLEELPSMADAELPVPEAVDETVTESADAAMDWLEELSEETIEDEAALDLGLEGGDLEPADVSLDWLEALPEAEAEEEQEPEEAIEADLSADVPASMDDAMVWLDALAEEQSVQSEEQSGLEDESGLAVDEEPADLDEAMGWLEDLAAEQDTPLEDLPTIAGVVDEDLFAELEPEAASEPESEEPADELTEALDWLEQLALQDSGTLVTEAAVETAVSNSEDDLAEALDWLEKLAQPEIPAEEPASGMVELDFTDEMPEDPDEALVWLQQVAAEQEEI
ncbi:MAG: tetratricopeptide repeat protein, partial [Ardenticatenaceae bacterium]|nr:tetratricopeptide repeat protein [Ardenticatenaceae bacterium]